MNTLLGYLVLSALAETAFCLSCYTCSSKSSWTECEENLEKIVCSPWLDSCTKVYTVYDFGSGRQEIYEKGCFYKPFCNEEVCKKVSAAVECEISCCDLEFCNGAPSLAVSWFLCGACAFTMALKHIPFGGQPAL